MKGFKYAHCLIYISIGLGHSLFNGGNVSFAAVLLIVLIAGLQLMASTDNSSEAPNTMLLKMHSDIHELNKATAMVQQTLSAIIVKAGLDK